MTYMATPQHKNPCPGSHEIYKFGRPFFGHDCYTLSLYGPRTGAEKIFMKYINFTLFTQNYLPLGWRSWNLQNYCLLTLQMRHTKFG